MFHSSSTKVMTQLFNLNNMCQNIISEHPIYLSILKQTKHADRLEASRYFHTRRVFSMQPLLFGLFSQGLSFRNSFLF